MTESILLTIRKLVGIGDDDNSFDTDLIIHINSILVILYQMGVGLEAFEITGEDETWDDYLTSSKNLNLIKTYIAMKTRQIFDPPTSGIVQSSVDNLVKELEWRINIEVDPSHD